VPYVDIAAQFAEERERLLPLVERVLAAGHYVGGAEVEALEAAIARDCGVAHCVGVASGTDALVLSLRALGIGRGAEVITAPNSFIATAAAIVQAGARPVFADVLDDQNLDPDRIEAAITPATAAVMPVHLTGRVAAMDRICAVARRHGLAVVEDAAQSMGSRYGGRSSGTWGDVGCFSAHPLKNLNALGDAGFLVTEDADLARRVRRLRNHGLVDRNKVAEWGVVSRLDTLQAAVLLHRLERLPAIVARRRGNAELYRALLDREHVFWPPCRPEEFNTFHTFVVQVEARDALQARLADQGIGTAIHYPVPIHLQPAAAELGYRRGDFPVAERQAGRILSLPVHQSLHPDDIAHVAATINSFYR
jgi:dTDP-4-amino-4,6-dideoxygalactose transaminase